MICISEKELEEKIDQAQSDEEVIRIFADAGLTVSPEDLKTPEENESDELSEDKLEDVTGGSIAYIVKKLLTRYKNRSKGGGGFGALGGGGGGGGGR